MLRSYLLVALAMLGGVGVVPVLVAAEDEAARRGEKALLGRAFIPPFWTREAYDSVWRQWGNRSEPPADYATAVQERYGLHPAPYPNNGFPMGLRTASLLFRNGVAIDCLLCHGGAIAGQSYVGLGNSALDAQALVEELSAAGGQGSKTPRAFSNVRGTTEVGAILATFFASREPDLSFRKVPVDLGLRDDSCEDVPAWWLLKKKKTMYHTGSTSARSVRSLMQALLPINPTDVFTREEPVFRDIRAYLLSLEPPRYPFPIDRDLAHQGQAVFAETCARCHGTYGERPTYPNRIVPLDEIGTDRVRYDSVGEVFVKHYNSMWFAQEHGDDGKGYPMERTGGYQAPPLDGIWATAPYLHNGSVPTVYHLLNSRARPRIFTRSYRTGKEEYDPTLLGWKVQVLAQGPDPNAPAIERRKVYDTTQPGRSNGGHTFGDKLSDEQRRAVIEYLKTL